MILFVAKVSAGAVVPFLLTAAASLRGVLGPILVELRAGRAGYARIAAKAVLPTVTKTLDVAKKIRAAADAATAYSLPVDLAGVAVTGFVAKLNARIARLQALLDLVAEVESIAAGGGVYLFLYQGTLVDLEDVLGGPAGIAAQAGISLDAPVYVPLYAVDATDDGAVQALKTILAGVA